MSDVYDTWCSNDSTSLGVTATGIGSGMANTTTADFTCTSGAIQEAANYTNNGISDWFLPSKDELAQLYTNRSVIGSYSSSSFWSSSEYDGSSAHAHNLSSNYISDTGIPKSYSYFLRPVRAF
jgi:hypothetical protein